MSSPHKRYELGPFVVRFVPSRHSKLLFGRKIPMDGELTCDHLHGLCPGAYRCGQVWGIRIDVAGISLYHQGSADLDDDELRDGPVDVFLAGVAGRSFTPRYWERILPRLDPRSSCRRTTTTSSRRSGGGWTSCARCGSPSVPGEIAAVSARRGSRRSRGSTRVDRERRRGRSAAAPGLVEACD